MKPKPVENVENIEALCEIFKSACKHIDIEPYQLDELWAALWECLDPEESPRWLN
jgi:hypothetical protein